MYSYIQLGLVSSLVQQIKKKKTSRKVQWDFSTEREYCLATIETQLN